MKKLIFLICTVLAVAMSSCLSKFSDKFYFLDYSRFTEKGFFITEAPSVPFDYNPIGSVLLEEKSGTKEITAVHKPGTDSIYGEDNSVTTKNKYEYASSDTALEALEKFAKENGADGIINLRVTSYHVGNRFTISISGMLIKRK